MLQVLVDDKKKNTYYAHTRWGRVGEDGQVKTTKESSLDAAKKEYEKKFKDKSGLEWSNRTDTPKDKKYTYIEKSYENDDDDDAGDDDKDDKTTTVKSELDLPTQKLMELIFKYVYLAITSASARHANVVHSENHFNAVLEALGYNQDKLPLGKLGKPTLKQGFEQLKELASLVKHPSLAKNKYNKDRKEVSLLTSLFVCR